MENEKKNVEPDRDEEFERVYHTHSTLILNIAYKYLHDTYLAEDVMQEVMIRYLNCRQTKDIAFEKNWLIKITRNLCINLLKKQKREIASDVIDLVSDFNQTKEAEMLSPEYQLIQEEYRQELNGLCEDIFGDLEQRKKQWHHAIHEVCKEERPEREVAHELGMTNGSFYTMLSRVKHKVQKEYTPKYMEIKKT